MKNNNMKKMVLASSNKHKIEEFREMFPDYQILSLADVGFTEEIEENGTTFLENATIKAKAVAKFLKTKNICATIIADDSGLCVDALNGAPGVYSARYAGNHDFAANRKKLLADLKNKKNRAAHFVCVIVMLSPDGKCSHVEGQADGVILDKEVGENGFGYDSLFLSDDLHKSFAQSTSQEKNSVSHRARAIEKLKKII